MAASSASILLHFPWTLLMATRVPPNTSVNEDPISQPRVLQETSSEVVKGTPEDN
ncbi:hypothetical protein CCACVL1_25385 [Corchorus capsularis]|uniref:Uncharacterized protein n=1 Tax=Corchorus capsularis TaxID=210143 RepID=A0A1R3GKW5_COCAP|nr:hypothetical protein CCACVL1_25385 [Corchorus capsularis]